MAMTVDSMKLSIISALGSTFNLNNETCAKYMDKLAEAIATGVIAEITSNALVTVTVTTNTGAGTGTGTVS